MAVVYEAEEDATGLRVALKRPMPWEGCDDRLRREADVLSRFDHRHVMRILDLGQDEDEKHWYAMPLARGSLRSLWAGPSESPEAEALARIVLGEIGSGLGALHEQNYVHRDVKPANVLAIPDDGTQTGYRWVIADLGLVRRPPGETTNNQTGSALVLGTLGYIAPEVHGDPSSATAAADVYGLGRVLAWILTGQVPVLTEPLLPQGRWRGIIREFTNRDPARRPQSIEEAIARANELLADLPISLQAEFSVALRRQNQILAATDPLWGLALENAGDHAFVIDDLVRVDERSAQQFASARPEDAARLAESMAGHLVRGDWGRRGFDFANAHLSWIQSVLDGLTDIGRHDLFEDVATGYAEAVQTWNRFPHNARLGRWLKQLGEPAGVAMARAIRQAGASEFFQANFGTDHQEYASVTLAASIRP